MKRSKEAHIASVIAFVLLFISGAAADKPSPPPQSQQTQASTRDPSGALPGDSVTHHTMGVGAQPQSYTATAGALPLPGPAGETAAKVFYVAYTLDDAANRPVTFIFNGGPGAASAFLHLGALGPRVVNFIANGSAPIRPVQLSDNFPELNCWVAQHARKSQECGNSTH